MRAKQKHAERSFLLYRVVSDAKLEARYKNTECFFIRQHTRVRVEVPKVVDRQKRQFLLEILNQLQQNLVVLGEIGKF